MQRDDSLWKAVLEDIFDDFLRFFIPNADDLFDIERGFEFLDKELEQLFPPDEDEFQPRYVDKLVKVYTRNGEEWILVHVEVQGYTDPDFAQRMFTYYYRILDKYQRPITAFAILTDSNRRFHPTVYERSFIGTQLRYEFNTFKVLDQPDEDLDRTDNPFGAIIQTVKLALQRRKRGIGGEELLDLKLDLAKRLLAKKIPKGKIRILMDFLRHYVRFQTDTLRTKFDEQLSILTNQRKTMGLEEFLLQRAERQGEKKGSEQAKKQFIQNLLAKTDLSDNQIADLADVDVSMVIKLRSKRKP